MFIFVFSSETTNPIFGPTVNPHDPTRTVGGSSGGEAALIAGGGSILGFGSDIGGSLRIPAAMCGICTLKPYNLRLSWVCYNRSDFSSSKPLAFPDIYVRRYDWWYSYSMSPRPSPHNPTHCSNYRRTWILDARTCYKNIFNWASMYSINPDYQLFQTTWHISNGCVFKCLRRKHNPARLLLCVLVVHRPVISLLVHQSPRVVSILSMKAMSICSLMYVSLCGVADNGVYCSL